MVHVKTVKGESASLLEKGSLAFTTGCSPSSSSAMSLAWCMSRLSKVITCLLEESVLVFI